MDFRERLTSGRTLLLDGATGSELHRRGVDTKLPLWSAAALIHAPDVVAQIHADYVAAGAEIVTTKTFRTRTRTLARAPATQSIAASSGETPRDVARRLTRTAVDLARSAKPRFIAGSIGPLEDCYSPDLVPSDAECQREHKELARDLADAGVDLLLVETMNTIREAVAAARAALATGLPTIVSFVCRSDGRLLSGESVSDAARALLTVGASQRAAAASSSRDSRGTTISALSINCTPTTTIDEPLQELIAAVDRRVHCGVYANVGRTNDIDGWTSTEDVDPKSYADHARRWLELGIQFLGGCCGTTPEHIAKLRELLHTMG